MSGRVSGRRRVALAGVMALAPIVLAACVPMAGAGSGAGEEDLVPPGYGSLHQDEITLTLRDGSVWATLTPLDEWIIRLTAPDAYRRLSGLAERHREAASPGAPERTDPILVLVSFFSNEEGAAFHPEDVRLEHRGRRYTPREVRPMSAGWGTQRLRAREALSAVYSFDGELEFDQDLVATYRAARTSEWARIHQALLAETARVRARGG